MGAVWWVCGFILAGAAWCVAGLILLGAAGAVAAMAMVENTPMVVTMTAAINLFILHFQQLFVWCVYGALENLGDA